MHSFLLFRTLRVSFSVLHYRLTKHATMSLKKLEKLVKARNADTTFDQRREKCCNGRRMVIWIVTIAVYLSTKQDLICIYGATLRDQKKGESAKIELPNNKGITITIIGAICEKSIVDLILRKPKTVQRKAVSSKEKKKRRQL